MKITKKHIITVIAMLAVLAAVFWQGGNAPGLKGWIPDETVSTQNTDEGTSVLPEANVEKQENNPKKKNKEAVINEQKQNRDVQEIERENRNGETVQTDNASKDDYTDSKIIKTPSGNKDKSSEKKETLRGMYDSAGGEKSGIPKPAENESNEISTEKGICTLMVKCDTILDNIDRLKPEKRRLVPDEGIIFSEKEVVFYKGESVFNVLLREMRRSGIHLEYVNTPIYKSAYIEGINNLYEFDCGELSGWIYRVNGNKPDYGCSRYILSDGDRIEFDYTCNLGSDIK